MESQAILKGLKNVLIVQPMAGGGARPGAGRPSGPNKATLERMERVRLLEQVAQAAGLAPDAAEKVAAVIDRRKAHAREEMEEAVPILKSIVAHFSQNTIALAQQGATPAKADWDTLKAWFEFYVDLLHKLAPYQSPTFRAIVVAPPPPEHKGEKFTRFGLKVFEGGRSITPAPAPAPQNGPAPAADPGQNGDGQDVVPVALAADDDDLGEV